MLNKKLPLLTIPVIAFTLTGCLSTKGYQPSPSAETATLSYEIDPSSFYSPERYINQGYIERFDIQLKSSKFGNFDTIHMENKNGLIPQHERNEIEANKELLILYQHKFVQGLGEWPMVCAIGRYVTLQPNRNYLLKGKTVVENQKVRKALIGKYYDEDVYCQIQIVDKDTNQIIIDSGLQKVKK